MRYYLIAGEASGDLHGANLMQHLKLKDPAAEFRYFGGDMMAAQGGEISRHYSDMAFMGFIEVIANIRKIMRNLAYAKKDITDYKPDAVILIDFPGFNLKVASFAKEAGFKVFYYISPKVWAWNQKRVLKIKKVVDYMLCILPFEVDFYKTWGMEVDYIGNPLLDAIAAHKVDDQFKITHNLDVRPIVALLPGSRKQEIQRILPVMLMAADRMPAYQFVIAGAPTFTQEYYRQFIQDRQLKVLFNATYDLLLNARAAVVTSGTATLEAALLRVPQVVVYKGAPVSVSIARLVVNIKYISLVNLVMDDKVVEELIQQDCNPDKIVTELENLLQDPTYRTKMLINYDELIERTGKPGASERAAALILNYLSKNL
jgi:lipid-A-disaccharide synthase